MSVKATPKQGYREIAAWLLERCAELPPGSPIPSELQLAEMFGVHRMTARHALETLRAAGKIERRQGAGSFTAQPPMHRDEALLHSFTEEIRRRGEQPSSIVIEQRLGILPERAMLMGLDPRQPLVRIYRVRCADDIPLALEASYLPGELAQAVDQDFSRTSLHQWLRDAGYTPAKATGFISARLASDRESRLLGQEPPTALLVEARIIRDRDDRVVESTETAYLSSRWAIDTSASVDV
ncbi:HTH-type transcriptional repressor NagR [Propionicimonas sp. T2.31MG-18]|uniref:GntR family transcriptional regulator n=1 Tax=Propionicimonas sp. T2.31MG-18 TaxID=3157620 RepID=UPI0035E6E859